MGVNLCDGQGVVVDVDLIALNLADTVGQSVGKGLVLGVHGQSFQA